MELQIELLGNSPNEQKQLIHLKKYLEKAGIPELKDIEIERTEAKAGEMGGGVLKGISTLLIGGEGPLTKLAEALVKYVEILRSEIKLKNRNGEELVINAKLNKKSINELVDKFYAESRKQGNEIHVKKEETDKKKLEESEKKKELNEPEKAEKETVAIETEKKVEK